MATLRIAGGMRRARRIDGSRLDSVEGEAGSKEIKKCRVSDVDLSSHEKHEWFPFGICTLLTRRCVCKGMLFLFDYIKHFDRSRSL